MRDPNYVGIFHCDSIPSFAVMQALPDGKKERARYPKIVLLREKIESGLRLMLCRRTNLPQAAHIRTVGLTG